MSMCPRRRRLRGPSEIFMRNTHAFRLVNGILKEYKWSSTDIRNFIGWKKINYYSYASLYKMSLCPWAGVPVHWSHTFAETLHFCLRYITAIAPYAMLRLQLTDVTTEETIDSTRHLASNMRHEMEASFNSSWLDAPKSRESVLRLLTPYQLIGMPKKLIPKAAMDDFYSYVPSATPDNFIWIRLDWIRLDLPPNSKVVVFAIAIVAHRAMVAHRKQLLVNRSDERFRVNMDDWEPPNISVNDYYVPVYHRIFLPGNILVPPFFALDMPDALNYGAVGWIVAHEMIHAFDKDWIAIDNAGDRRVFFTNNLKTHFLPSKLAWFTRPTS
ncbi:unnamed protein product [Ixodes pacificus]